LAKGAGIQVDVVFPLLTLLAWLERLGGLGLILLGLADNSPVPLPGSMDVLTILLSAHQRSWWPYYASMATLGSILGGYLSYALGREGGKEALEKRLSRERARKLFDGFEKRAFLALFLPALLPPPAPYTPFLLAAGALDYPRRKFLAVVALARALRYFTFAFLASRYGREILGFLARYQEPILWGLVGVGVVAGIGGLVYLLRRKRQGKPMAPKKKRRENTKAA
jgi:membrane protein YqaA with SNARE-associated domain